MFMGIDLYNLRRSVKKHMKLGGNRPNREELEELYIKFISQDRLSEMHLDALEKTEKEFSREFIGFHAKSLFDNLKERKEAV